MAKKGSRAEEKLLTTAQERFYGLPTKDGQANQEGKRKKGFKTKHGPNAVAETGVRLHLHAPSKALYALPVFLLPLGRLIACFRCTSAVW